MSDTKRLIEARIRDAKQRIEQFRRAITNAQVALVTAEQDLADAEQEEVEEQAADAHQPRLYHLALSNTDVNMLITLLGYNISIPELTAEQGTSRYQHAAKVIDLVRTDIAKQYYAYNGPRG